MINKSKSLRNEQTDIKSPKEKFLGIQTPSESISFQKPSFSIKLESMMKTVTNDSNDQNLFEELISKRSQSPKCQFSRLMSIQQNEFLSSRRRVETPPIPATPPHQDSHFLKKKDPSQEEIESEFSITEAKNNNTPKNLSLFAMNNTFTKEIAKLEDDFYRDERDPEKRFVGKMFLNPDEKPNIEKDVSLEDMKQKLSPYWGKRKLVSILKDSSQEDGEVKFDDDCKKKVTFNKKVMVKKIEMRNVLMNYANKKGH